MLIHGDAYPDRVNDELEQIDAYGGFYVARYEAGINVSSNWVTPETNNVYNITKTGLPVSKRGAKIWNFIRYFNAKKVSKAMINDETKYGENKSGLITGKQWDTIMRWFEESRIGVRKVQTTNSKGENVPAQDWGSLNALEYEIEPGTYSDSYKQYDWLNWKNSSEKVKHESGKDMIHASGLNPNGIKKNIADLCGNISELTSLITQTGKNQAHCYSGKDYASAHLNGDFAPHYSIGFRVVIYVNI